MLIVMLSLTTVAVAYVVGLLFGGHVDLFAAGVTAAAVVAWLARPMVKAFAGSHHPANPRKRIAPQ